MIIYAASTQRTIGLVLAIIVAAGFALYVLVNIRAGRKEIGAEVELAPNRKKYFDDENFFQNIFKNQHKTNTIIKVKFNDTLNVLKKNVNHFFLHLSFLLL